MRKKLIELGVCCAVLLALLLGAGLALPPGVQAPAAARVFFEAPAGERPAAINPGGETVLPNGRVITPRGTQLFTDPHPFGLALSPDGNTLATVNSGTKPFSVTLISLDSRVSATTAANTRTVTVPVNATFMGAVFSPDSRKLYLSGGNDGTILSIDVRSGRLEATIPLNDGRWQDSYIGDIASDAGGRYLYACDQANFRVVIIEAKQRRVVGSVRAGRYPFAVSLAPGGTRLYVANVGMFEYQPVPGGLSFPPFGFPSRQARDGTKVDGKDVPGLGDPNAPESFSVWEFDVSNPGAPRVLRRIKTGLPVGALVGGIPALGGSAPCAVLAGRRYVYVSNSNNDLVSLIDRATGRVVNEIALAPSPETRALRGVIPFGLAASPDESRLYVAEAGINAVGVIDVAHAKVVGHIPAGWFPSKLALSANGRTLYVANAKGFGSGPNGGPAFRPVNKSSFVGDIQRGTVSVMSIPGGAELDEATRRVMRNNGLEARTVPAAPPAFGQIRYVVYIVKENRTFDEVFGGFRAPRGQTVRGDASLVRLGPAVMPNHQALAARFSISDNFYVDSDVSADGHRWAVGVYPNAWVETSWPASYGKQRDYRDGSPAPGRRGFSESNSSVHPEDYLEAGSLWEHLERHGIPFRNYGEGFELAGNDEDEPHLPTGALLPANVPMPDSLFRNTCRKYPGFNMNVSDQYRFERFAEEFREFEKPGRDLPRLIFIHLPNDHMTKERPSAGYPRRESYAADNDLALGRLIEMLSGSRFWAQMAVFITEDDAQGGRDHVDAHRSLLLAAGPHVRPGHVSHVHANFGSILKTINMILGLPSLNLYDAAAMDLRDLLDERPHREPYRAVPPDKALFDPARVREGKAAVHQVLDDPDEARRQLAAGRRR